MRDGGVTGDDKKYSNIWNMQKAAMRGKEALLSCKVRTLYVVSPGYSAVVTSPPLKTVPRVNYPHRTLVTLTFAALTLRQQL